MDYQETMETIRAAIQTFGEENQTVVAIEELSELQKELCKRLRGSCDNVESIAEEVADVEIVLAQLCEMLGIDDLVTMYSNFKFKRLQSRIAAEQERRGNVA